MRSFQGQIAEFKRRGLNLVAISVDPVETNARQHEKLGLDFPLLSDSAADVIRRYHLLHPGGGPRGSDIARSAELLIDSAGVIRWVNITGNSTVRARPDQVLRVWDALGLSK